MENVVRMKWSEFRNRMSERCMAIQKGEPLDHISGVIVFKPESFTKEYSEESRSYGVNSDNKMFGDYCGSSLYGSCLDGSDMGVRLDYYMNYGEPRWKVDYCYMKEE